MPKVNHARGFKAKMYGYGGGSSGSHSDFNAPTVEGNVIYHHGPSNQHRAFPDKSMFGTGALLPLSDRHIGAHIGNDFTNGNRGMAKAVRGAKKFVRTRTRFHENAATRKLAESPPDEI